MTTLLEALLTVLLAYLIGAVPFGLLLGKFNGLDIRHHGSGNIGATNVTRVVGKDWGMACFILDFAKGLAPVLVARGIWSANSPVPVLVGLAVVAGHIWPVYIRFRGGKGMATSLGAVLALAPLNVLAAVIVWLLAFKVTRYVSAASIAAALMLPLSAIGLHFLAPVSLYTILLLLAIAGLIILRHRANIKRLLEGTESRFTKKGVEE